MTSSPDSLDILARRGFHVLASLSLVLIAGLAGCSSDGGSNKAGAGASCTVSKDCKEGLRCRGGACKAPPDTTGGGDATFADAVEGDGGGEQDAGEAGPSPEPENYYMSYLVENLAGGDRRELRLYSTETDEETVVNPEAVSCQNKCWLTDDLSAFVYTTRAATTGTRDVYVAQIGGDMTATGEGERLLQGVRDVQLRNNHLVYARSSSEGGERQRVLYYRKLKGAKGQDGREVEVGPVGVQGQSSWFVAPSRDLVVVYDQSQSGRISLKIGSVEKWQDSEPIVLDGRNYKETPTGLFGGIGDTAISRDGEVLAFYIQQTPNNYGPCTRKGDKSDPYAVQNQKCGPKEYGFRCGTESRCTRLESAVYFIGLKNRRAIGSDCRSQSDCGDYQKCYVPGNNIDQAKCIPGRAVVGVDSQEGLSASACSIAQSDPLVNFTGLSGELSFDDQGRVYVVGQRDRSCLAKDFENETSTQIIRIDPTERTSFDLTNRGSSEAHYQVVGGIAPDEAFDPGKCFDQTGFTLETCRTFIGEVLVSPGGNELAYTATNPNSGTGLAPEKLYAWHMLRDGSERWAVGSEETIRSNSNKKYLNLEVYEAP